MLYAYLSSVFLLPSLLVVWERLATNTTTAVPLFDIATDVIAHQRHPSSED